MTPKNPIFPLKSSSVRPIQGQKYLFRLEKFKSCFGKSKDAFLWCLLSETPDYYLNPVLTNHPHVYEALTIEHL